MAAQRASKRQRRQRDLKKAILIATNGRTTEREYLRRLKQVASQQYAVTVKSYNGEPSSVLKKLTSEKFDKGSFHEVWIVVDEDQEDRTQFLQTCQKNTWFGVVSRPCFEVWLIAHYEQVKNYANQRDAQKHYRSLIPAGTPEKQIPNSFPITNFAVAATQCHLPGAPEPQLNHVPSSPGSAMPLLLKAIGLG